MLCVPVTIDELLTFITHNTGTYYYQKSKMPGSITFNILCATCHAVVPRSIPLTLVWNQNMTSWV